MPLTHGTADGRSRWPWGRWPRRPFHRVHRRPSATTTWRPMANGPTLTTGPTGGPPRWVGTCRTAKGTGPTCRLPVMCGSGTIPSPTSPAITADGRTTPPRAGCGATTTSGHRHGLPPIVTGPTSCGVLSTLGTGPALMGRPRSRWETCSLAWVPAPIARPATCISVRAASMPASPRLLLAYR
jgi:hypothetical protein